MLVAALPSGSSLQGVTVSAPSAPPIPCPLGPSPLPHDIHWLHLQRLAVCMWVQAEEQGRAIGHQAAELVKQHQQEHEVRTYVY